MKKEKHRFKPSMRVTLIIVLVLMAMIPLMVGLSIGKDAVEKQILANRKSSYEYQCNAIAKYMMQNSFFSGDSEVSVDSELEQLAAIYNGRIVVVDESCRIVVDTYGADTGKYMLTASISDCFGGKDTSRYDEEQMSGTLVLAIREEKSTTVSGVMIATYSTENEMEIVGEIQDRYFLIEVIALLIVLIASVFFGVLLTMPLKKLREKMALAANGSTDALNVNGFSETADISRSYNASVQKLKDSENAQRQFVSNVSHELKTPLTSMRVLADSLLSAGDVPADLYKEFMGDISHEIDRENQIIEDLLTLVRMEQGTQSLKVAPANINELLENLLKMLKPIAQKNNVDVTFESFRPVVAEVDETKLNLAFMNLVENAIKYNRENGWVRVSLNADHRFFYVKVQDSGLGIPEEAQAHIFERFYRVDKARSREKGGTGLGLAITQNIIQLHNGLVRVYSRENEGSTFTVRIPLKYIQ